MKPAKSVPNEKKNAVLLKLEQLSKVQRISLWAGVLVLIVAAFVYFAYLPKIKKIDQLKTQLTKIEKDLEIAKKNALELNTYRKKMQDAEEQFKLVMRELPENEEIPTLLTGISKAGKDSGLNFLLFQPKPEVKKEFYAEIPVSMRMTGDYHGVATFFESVAGLNRIVNIRDITIAPEKGSQTLTTTCTAVTYKFIETVDAEETKPEKTPTKKKKR